MNLILVLHGGIGSGGCSHRTRDALAPPSATDYHTHRYIEIIYNMILAVFQEEHICILHIPLPLIYTRLTTHEFLQIQILVSTCLKTESAEFRYNRRGLLRSTFTSARAVKSAKYCSGLRSIGIDRYGDPLTGKFKATSITNIHVR